MGWVLLSVYLLTALRRVCNVKRYLLVHVVLLVILVFSEKVSDALFPRAVKDES